MQPESLNLFTPLFSNSANIYWMLPGLGLGQQHLWTSGRPHDAYCLTQGPATVFCKGPGSKYLNLCSSYGLCCKYSSLPSTKEPRRLCNNKTSLMDTEFWISYNFQMSWIIIWLLNFFQAFKKQTNKQTILSTGAPQKQVVGWIQLW